MFSYEASFDFFPPGSFPGLSDSAAFLSASRCCRGYSAQNPVNHVHPTNRHALGHNVPLNIQYRPPSFNSFSCPGPHHRPSLYYPEAVLSIHFSERADNRPLPRSRFTGPVHPPAASTPEHPEKKRPGPERRSSNTPSLALRIPLTCLVCSPYTPTTPEKQVLVNFNGYAVSSTTGEKNGK